MSLTWFPIAVALGVLLFVACAGPEPTSTFSLLLSPTPTPLALPRSTGTGDTLPGLEPLELEVAFPNFTLALMVHLTHSGDGTNRLFVVLQPGRIVVFANDQSVASAAEFLDIRDRVYDAGTEQGLLGLAFDPDYGSNSYFYVNYTTDSHTVVSRFSVSGDDPNVADSTSELVLLQVAQPFPVHNGGSLAFGPDGYLYIGLGDGGSVEDALGNGQDLATLLGSILRIDLSRATPEATYAIPPDNPFTGTGAREEIWAYGLRNPWRFAFDAETGDLWAGDVGLKHFEEIDIILPGRNYGWSRMEGLLCFPTDIQDCDRAGLEMPVVEYAHSADEGRFARCAAVVGGSVYRGTRFPSLYGAYGYADFCSGEIWALRYDGNQVTEHILLNSDSLITNFLPSFGEDEEGEIYILSFDGNIYRVKAP